VRPPKAGGRGRGAPRGRKAPIDELARERRIRGKIAELGALLTSGKVDPDRTRAYLAGELEGPPMDSADLATSIRLPGDLVARADALAERRAVLLGERASRSAVLRLAIERGIAALEREAAELEAPSTRAALLAELDALRERVAVLGGNDGR
jgi:predicted DNA-binding protein